VGRCQERRQQSRLLFFQCSGIVGRRSARVASYRQLAIRSQHW